MRLEAPWTLLLLGLLPLLLILAQRWRAAPALLFLVTLTPNNLHQLIFSATRMMALRALVLPDTTSLSALTALPTNFIRLFRALSGTGTPDGSCSPRAMSRI